MEETGAERDVRRVHGQESASVQRGRGLKRRTLPTDRAVEGRTGLAQKKTGWGPLTR